MKTVADIQLTELPYPDRPLRYALEGWQCATNLGNSSNRDRPTSDGECVIVEWSPNDRLVGNRLARKHRHRCPEMQTRFCWRTEMSKTMQIAMTEYMVLTRASQEPKKVTEGLTRIEEIIKTAPPLSVQ